MQEKTISIYFSDTGGGHRSAAGAIKAGIESIIEKEFSSGIHARIHLRAIAEKLHPLTRCLTAVYNHMARYNLATIKFYCLFLNLLHPESDVYYGLYRSYLERLLAAQKPSIIVSVHPMIAHCLTHALQELGLTSSVKMVVVVTDPNERLWHAWACQRADLIIAPNEVVRDQLLEWNISPDKIKVLGMPIHPKFLAPPAVTRGEFLKSLGLDPDVFTICVNAGWAGNPHLVGIYRALAPCERKPQVIFLSGYNQRLHSAAERAAQETGIPTAVLPFMDQMADLMGAVDVMITKAGGLTTYEALARRLPLVLDKTIEPMPQEESTLKMLVDAGVAQELNRPEDIVQIINHIQFSQAHHEALPTQYQLNLTDDAVYNIARTILLLGYPELRTEQSIQDITQQPGKY